MIYDLISYQNEENLQIAINFVTYQQHVKRATFFAQLSNQLFNQLDEARRQSNASRITYLGHLIQRLMEKVDAHNAHMHEYKHFAESDVAGVLLPDRDVTELVLDTVVTNEVIC